MSALRLVFASLAYHARTHAGVVLGCAISTAVLVGALFVGDSVHRSLERIAVTRLGSIDLALETGDRYFRFDLADRIGEQLGSDATVAPMMRVEGMALAEREGDGGGWNQVNRVEVLGIDARFFELVPEGIAAPAPLEPGEIAISERLAAELDVEPGAEISVRLRKPGLLSEDAPLASRDDRGTRRERLQLAAIVPDAALGRFSLRAEQVSPYNAFVDLAWLQETVELEGAANRLLVAIEGVASEPASTAVPAEAQAALRQAWRLVDAGVVVRDEPDLGIVQIESPRIFLDPAVVEAASAVGAPAVGTVTYLVESIIAGDASTPYSFVTALGASDDERVSLVPPAMGDDEILVNAWLADHLGIAAGDSVDVEYSVLAAGDAFERAERTFRVRDVIAMDRLTGERVLAPEFPGLTDVDSCADWDIGLTTDEEALEDPDNEAYWEEYRETPKAIVTLEAGRSMWGNRFGDQMGVRFARTAEGGEDGIADALRANLDPADVALAWRPVRGEALRAASQSMDLGQLFLGMSFFLIGASLLLTGMLFVFTVEQRARETGVLLAVGWTAGRVRRLLLAEGAALAVVGSVLGVPLGFGFAAFLIRRLESSWSGAIADASVSFHADFDSAVIGVVAGSAVSLLAIAVVSWRQAKRPVRELVAGDVAPRLGERPVGARRRPVTSLAIGIGGLALAAASVAWTVVTDPPSPAGAFFGAGFLALVGGLGFVRHALAKLATGAHASRGVGALGRSNAGRRPGRGLATAGMLAAGVFLVLSVSAMQEDLDRQAGVRASGTGGFELYGETSVAVHVDLNSEEGRDEFRLRDDETLADVDIVPVRVRDGDDASCLNLNLSLTPPLLGIDPERFAELGAFASPEEADRLFALLEEPSEDGIVPAIIGDSATAVWKLRKKVGRHGDVLEYVDERGETFGVRLVAAIPQRLSVLQGRLLIAERDFTQHFPGEAGHRLFLVDTPPDRVEGVRDYLTERLDTVGLDLVPSVERLEQFYTVEATYLRMFVVLGGLGLLLGSAGVGVLVLRNVMERRGELALLRSIGFSKERIGALVSAELRFLVAAGLATGTAAAALAIVPTWVRPEIQIPYGLLAAFLGGTAALAVLSIRLATQAALRGRLVDALRSE